MAGEDARDPPIAEQEWRGGVNVVDIGEVRVSRGLSRRHHSSCPHKRLTYDQAERRIWCRDCERDVEGFDAFRIVAEWAHVAHESLLKRERAVQEAEGFAARTIAGKKLDEAWRSKTMVPACPSCGNGLFPEHIKAHGFSMLGRDFAKARLLRPARLVTKTEGETHG